MTGQTGIFVARDGSNNGTTPKGARQAFGGLLAGNGASALDVRRGVLADALGAVVVGKGNMSYDVRPFRVVTMTSTANGPVVAANDATVNVVTTAAPGSNSRIDVIWCRQHLVAGDGGSDSDVILEIGVTQGAVAASPSVPSIPSGALSLAQVTVTAGATATNTLTFTRSHAWTVANGGVVPVYTSTERSAITPYPGMMIWYDPDKNVQVWDGDSWEPLPKGDTGWQTLTLQSGYQALSAGYTPQYRIKNGRVMLRGIVARTSGTFTTSLVTVAILDSSIAPTNVGVYRTTITNTAGNPSRSIVVGALGGADVGKVQLQPGTTGATHIGLDGLEWDL